MSTGFASLIYECFESQIKKCRTSRVVCLSLVASIAIFGLGVLSVYNHGFLNRYPAELRKFFMYNYDHSAAFREGKCLLDEKQSKSNFSKECISNIETEPKGKINVLIWGDSHAAHLYPGLVGKSMTNFFNVGELTVSGCPPILNFSSKKRPHCKDINDYVFDKIDDLHINTVILAASWSRYDPNEDEAGNPWGTVNFSDLQKTVSLLEHKKLKVIVVGGVPTWKTELFNVLIDEYDKFHSTKFKERSFNGLDQNAFTYNKHFGVEISSSKIRFISMIDLFCNFNGCLRYFGNTNFLVSFDQGHLTVESSELVAQNLKPMLLNH